MHLYVWSLFPHAISYILSQRGSMTFAAGFFISRQFLAFSYSVFCCLFQDLLTNQGDLDLKLYLGWPNTLRFSCRPDPLDDNAGSDLDPRPYSGWPSTLRFSSRLPDLLDDTGPERDVRQLRPCPGAKRHGDHDCQGHEGVSDVDINE